MTSEEQLAEWVKGNSIHRFTRPGDTTSGECCPDFSCCVPGIQWPVAKREAFAKAVATGDDKTKYEMLGSALSAALDYHEIRKVKIIGP